MLLLPPFEQSYAQSNRILVKFLTNHRFTHINRTDMNTDFEMPIDPFADNRMTNRFNPNSLCDIGQREKKNGIRRIFFTKSIGSMKANPNEKKK